MTITVPRIRDFCVPIEALLHMLFPDAKVLIPPKNSKKTLELGARHSPEFVCVPFKYNLGNMIEALEAGADAIIVVGGGCRYGYYGEVQEQILRDLGYNFTFVSFYGKEGLKLRQAYKTLQTVGCKVSYPYYLYALLLASRMFKLMDKNDAFIRENVGFETRANSFEALKKEFYAELLPVRSFTSLRRTARKYNRAFKALPVNPPVKPLHVGIVGELYTVMEPFANFFMEKALAKYNIRVSRFTDADYLLFKDKRRKEKRNLKEAGGYVKYYIGADGTHSVAKCRSLALEGCDGVIHVKPFGCMPENSAMPALINIGADHNMPVLFFSFDAQTSEQGVKTRLEAFYDMLVMRKEKLTTETNSL